MTPPPSPGHEPPAAASADWLRDSDVPQEGQPGDNGSKRKGLGPLLRAGSAKRLLASARAGASGQGGKAAADERSLLDDEMLLSGLGWEMANDREDSSAHGSFAVAAAMRRAGSSNTLNPSELASMARTGLDIGLDASVTGGSCAAAALGAACPPQAPHDNTAVPPATGYAAPQGAFDAWQPRCEPIVEQPQQQQPCASPGTVSFLEARGAMHPGVSAGSGGALLPPPSAWRPPNLDSSIRGGNAAAAALQQSLGAGTGRELGRPAPDSERASLGVLPDDEMPEGLLSQAAAALFENPMGSSGALLKPSARCARYDLPYDACRYQSPACLGRVHVEARTPSSQSLVAQAPVSPRSAVPPTRV